MNSDLQALATLVLHYLQCPTQLTVARQRSGGSAFPGIPSEPHLGQPMPVAELIEQRPGVFQVGGAKALGKPVVDIGEHCAGFIELRCLRISMYATAWLIHLMRLSISLLRTSMS